MMHLITGGSASGKSAYAESQVLACGDQKRYYIATMRPWGEEGRARVEKHRKMRREKKFETVECYTNLEQIRLDGQEMQQERQMQKEWKKSQGNSQTVSYTVLLECMSNLVANEQFETGGTDEEILDRIERGIRNLDRQAEHLVIVTNEIFSDGCSYEPETLRYISLLGQINIRLAAMADRVTEVVFGIPVPWR